MNWESLIASTSTLLAALTFLAGVTAWKREYIGRRRLELSESVLVLFYRAEGAIQAMRNPLSSTAEGAARKRSADETPSESGPLDSAYVLIKRFQDQRELFAELRAARFRYMAVFGKSAAAPFDEIEHVLAELVTSAEMLGRHYWPMLGLDSMEPEERGEMQKHQENFWRGLASPDPVDAKVAAAVAKVEATTRALTEGRASTTAIVQRFLRRN